MARSKSQIISDEEPISIYYDKKTGEFAGEGIMYIEIKEAEIGCCQYPFEAVENGYYISVHSYQELVNENGKCLREVKQRVQMEIAKITAILDGHDFPLAADSILKYYSSLGQQT